MSESARFQQGSLLRQKNKATPDSWMFRYRVEGEDGRRSYKNVKVGSVVEFPLRKDAEKAVLQLRANINSGEPRTPETVQDLVTHFTVHELTPERRAFSTLENYRVNLNLHVIPKWGSYRLSAVRTVAVEAWLHSLPLAPGTRTKIRNIMSALWTHAIRYEWITANVISKVRCSGARLREPDVLTPDEFRALLSHLALREQAMVTLAGATGLRRSEMFALRWADLCTHTMQVYVTKGVYRSRVGGVKTKSSARPVPLHGTVLAVLLAWRAESPYSRDEDFLFPSVRRNGTQPLQPDMILKKYVRPALVRAGITDKIVGWHSFRHSLATNLRHLGVDVKVAAEMLRHSSTRLILETYTHAVSADKRAASGRQMDMLLGSGGAFAPSDAPSAFGPKVLEAVNHSPSVI